MQTQTSMLQRLFLMNHLKKKRFILQDVLQKCDLFSKKPKILNLNEFSQKFYLEQYYKFYGKSYCCFNNQIRSQSRVYIDVLQQINWLKIRTILLKILCMLKQYNICFDIKIFNAFIKRLRLQVYNATQIKNLLGFTTIDFNQTDFD